MSWRSTTRSALNLCILGFLGVAASHAAEMKKQTLDAWNQYLVQENATILDRAASGHCFLRIENDPRRMQEIHDGAMDVKPVAEGSPKHVPGGLIHHWIGDMFIPAVTVDDVLAVTRNYTRYSDYYKPGVADAQTVASTDDKDEFILYLQNMSVLSKSLLKGQYVSNFVRVDDKRLYSVSQTKQMQEIKDYGGPNETYLPPGKGSGYIWQMFSTARFEERDGGVYLEVEAIALSRDIPITLHWLVDPIVRRVSHDALGKSLQDTARAAKSHNIIAQVSR